MRRLQARQAKKNVDLYDRMVAPRGKPKGSALVAYTGVLINW